MRGLDGLPPNVQRAIALGRGLPRESAVGRAAIARAPGVRPRGRSKLQARYADECELLRHAGELLDVVEEGLSLRLADRTWYRPDFLLRFPDGHLEVHEVKGHWEDDARAKLKVAAELHGWVRFAAISPDRGGAGGWKREDIPGPRSRR